MGRRAESWGAGGKTESYNGQQIQQAFKCSSLVGALPGLTRVEAMAQAIALAKEGGKVILQFIVPKALAVVQYMALHGQKSDRVVHGVQTFVHASERNSWQSRMRGVAFQKRCCCKDWRAR